jgi:hypothetical protein
LAPPKNDRFESGNYFSAGLSPTQSACCKQVIWQDRERVPHLPCHASNAGIRSVSVSVSIASGVNLARDVPLVDAAKTLFANEPAAPIAVMQALAW